MKQIQPGDVLLFKGTTPIISPLIRWATNSEYTHVAIAVSEDLVYEIDIDRRLAIHPIREGQYDVFRYRYGLTPHQRAQLTSHAIRRAKKSRGYDWFKILSFGLEKIFRFPIIFNEINNEVCSEIVDYLFDDIGIDLVPDRERGHVTPAHISASPELIKVFSHTASHKSSNL